MTAPQPDRPDRRPAAEFASSLIVLVTGMAAILGIGMLVAGVAAATVGDVRGGVVLAVTAAGLIIMNQIRQRVWKRSPSAHLAVNSAAVAIGWSTMAVVAAAPIWMIAMTTANPNETVAAHRQWINPLYDATSSITSTGLSTSASSSQLPPLIQLWRSVGQWIGGVGIAIFALVTIGDDRGDRSFYRAETRQWRMATDCDVTLGRIVALYGVLTVGCVTSFGLLGMPIWQAINHGLSIVSTGGLTVTDDSFTGYSNAILATASVFMLLSGTSFAALYLLSTLRLKSFVRRSDVHALIAATVVILGLAAGWLHFRSSANPVRGIFNTLSGLMTCGVSAGDLATFPAVLLMLIVAAMVIGACSDSTVGGIKVNRIWWILKTVGIEVSRVLDPERRSDPPRWNGHELDDDAINDQTRRHLIIGFSLVALHVAGAVALRVAYDDSIGNLAVLFQSVSATSTVGLSMGISGPDRPTSAKLIEIALMLLGRLEVMAFLFILPVALGRARVGSDSIAERGEEA